MSAGLTVADVRAALERAGLAVVAARDELSALDAAAGDGDIGTTLQLGMEGGIASLAEPGETDVGDAIATFARGVGGAAAGTVGILLSSSLRAGGRALAGVDALDGEGAAVLLEEIAAAVGTRGGVTVGQRTILDSMDESARAARAAASAGLGVRETLASAADGAEHGADATATMVPTVGRAGWIGERAQGQRDAGAAAWAVFLRGFADSGSAT